MIEDGPRTPDLDAVRGAYASWSPAYIAAFGAAEKASDEDRALIADWADELHGPVLDAGCGPGHWSAFLHGRGLQVEGVDATPEFVAHAQRSYPGIPFRRGDLRSLGLTPASLGGVLAWFSLIHTDPAEVPPALRDLADALQPGGSLLLGYFTGPELRQFDHRVVTAWAWPAEQMAEAVGGTGLRIARRSEHRQPNGRITASLVAHRPA